MENDFPEDIPAQDLLSLPSTHAAAWEAVAILQNAHKRRARRWDELLEEKEQLINALKERVAGLEVELARGEDERRRLEGLLENAWTELLHEKSAREQAQGGRPA